MATVNIDESVLEKMSEKLINEGLERVGIFMSAKVTEKIGSTPWKRSVGGLLGSVFYIVDKAKKRCRVIVNKEYAAIQEYGGEITPKQKKALTVPVHPDAYGKTATDFPDLVFIDRKGKAPLLVRINKTKGGVEKSFDIMFVLSKKVKIKPTPYLGPALNENLDKITEVFVGIA